MKTILFKTKKLAEEHIRENYPESTYRRRAAYITENDRYDTDILGLCWSGETPAWMIEDENLDTVATIGWWEEGDDVYELFVGDKLVATFDNMPDALEAKDEAIRI